MQPNEAGRCMMSARTLCWGLVVILINATPAAAQTPSPGVALGGTGSALVSLNFAATAVGDFPTNLTMLDGVTEVVSMNGQHVLRASARSAFLIRLPQVLPNDFTIETDSITYQLFANTSSEGDTWQPVLQRTYAQRIVIPEEERTRVEIPIEFNYSEMSGAARSILNRGTFNYRIQGNAYVREPLKRTIPFTKSGNVSLSGAR